MIHKVFINTLCKSVFDNAAEDCYISNVTAFKGLFEDKEKYNLFANAVANEIYDMNNRSINI